MAKIIITPGYGQIKIKLNKQKQGKVILVLANAILIINQNVNKL